MKLQQIGIAALGAATLMGATLALTLDSNAQGDQNPPTQGGPPAGPRNFGGGQGGPPGAPGQPGQFRPGQGMMGGGGSSAMESDNSFLYVLQGNMLFKVQKSDLKVLGSTPLMQGQQEFGNRFPQGRPGGAQAGPPPPPPAKD
jgi:hypothetical protein